MSTVHIEYTLDFDLDELDLKEKIGELLAKHNKSDSTLVVVLTDNKTLVDLAIQYMKETPEEAENHPVLSFPVAEMEREFSYPPDLRYLGEVLVSVDWVTAEAKKTGKSRQELVVEMALHGTLHLLGIHHD